MGLTRDNHFIPQMYLKSFATASGKVSEYRTLVSHESVPMWKSVSVAGTGYEKHLYTRIVRGEQSDDIEQWLSSDFEAPAKESLEKVLADEDPTKADWRILTRFLAAQIVRTPAFLAKNLSRWNNMTREALDETFKEVDSLLKEAKASGKGIDDVVAPAIPEVSALYREYIPMKIDRQELKEERRVKFTGRIVVGRGHWFFAMKRMLTSTLKVLETHRWAILEAPARLPWFTSDDPVICLNFRSESDYDFGGGWGRAGANILFPLSPRHLMFTEIGANAYPRKVPSRFHARLFRRMIAEHAYRKIYSLEEEEKVGKLRPRKVDSTVFRAERTLWKTWYHAQSEAEQSLWADHSAGLQRSLNCCCTCQLSRTGQPTH